MKTILRPFKPAALTLIALMLFSIGTRAATYTASASGNWTSSATWAGGTAPSLNLSGDQVIIPSGITVTLANTLNVNGGLAALAISGTLTSGASDSLILGQGAITGTGQLSVSNLVLSTGSTLAFAGSVVANTVTNWAVGLQAAANFTVNQSLVLAAGSLNIATNGLLSMTSNSNIIVTGGSLATSGGALTLTASYNVTYLSGSAMTGLELTGSGLNNVTVNVPWGDSIALNTNPIVNGTLTLTNGNLALNGWGLTLAGSIAAGGGGLISSNSSSSLTVNTTSSGTLSFSATGDTIGYLIINTGGSGSLTLGSNLNVSGTLTLTNGTLNAGNNQLSITGTGNVSGGSSASYVIASGSGSLGMQVTAGGSNWTTFQVGTSASYAPAAVQLNSGSTSGMVNISATAGVLAQGTSGTDLSLTQPAVNVTWMVEPVNTSNVSLNLQAMWSASMQVNGFNPDSAYISHYTSGSWDASAVGAATLQGGLYSMTRTDITSFSPFAVFGSNAATGIAEVNAEDANFVVYPNPAHDNILIKNMTGTNRLNLDVIDINGQVVNSYILTDYTTSLSLQNLASGNYIIKLYNDNVIAIKRFTKM